MTETITIKLEINGIAHSFDLPPRTILADLLRERLGLKGTKVACDQGTCGACTILIDDRPMTSCSMFAFAADGARLTTIEGLSVADGPLHLVQAAFHDMGVPQCGFCSPGMVLLAKAFLDARARGEHVEAEDWMSANICRCSGYGVFRRALARFTDESDDRAPE